MIQARELLNQTHPDNCPKFLFSFGTWKQSIKYFGRDFLLHFKAAYSQDKFNKSDLSSPLIHDSRCPRSLALNTKL